MGRRKKMKKYLIHWSIDMCGQGQDRELEVPAEDVEGMSEDERQIYFQQQVDEEVRINGPCGFVDSVDELDE